jgi:hypothetical protein
MNGLLWVDSPAAPWSFILVTLVFGGLASFTAGRGWLPALCFIRRGSDFTHTHRIGFCAQRTDSNVDNTRPRFGATTLRLHFNDAQRIRRMRFSLGALAFDVAAIWF